MLREVWFNIPGSAVADLTNSAVFAGAPGLDEVITNGFETPTNVYDDYGQRLRALLVPPTSGNYYFYIASDDASHLYLGTNNTPQGKRLIAQVNGWTPSREYNLQGEQKSAAVYLVAGQQYYLEALMKEGWGGDNLAVTWQRPGTSAPANGSPPIPNNYLIPYGVGPPSFHSQPVSVSVVEGGSAGFGISLARSLGASLQWIRNGTNLPNATGTSVVIAPVRLSDSGNQVWCRATNAYGASNSSVAILTVTADVVRPAVVSARCLGETTLVMVLFSEPVDPISAGKASNFVLNNGASVVSAQLTAEGRVVLLRTSPLASDVNYILTLNNIRDLAQTPNTILPNSQVALSVSYTPLDVTYVTGAVEPVGPSSRRTGLAISEIMYHPALRNDGRNLEFIELFNSNPWAEDLSGYRLSGDIGYTFPKGISIGARSYRVIAANPTDVQTVYGLSNVLGPFTNSTAGNATNVLANGGGTLRLRDELNSVLLEIDYKDEPPWPVAADGAGHSLVLARPSYGEQDFRAWARSDRVGGSPGATDSTSSNPWRSVLINEVLAHTDLPQEDFVELFNYSTVAVNVGDCILTDDPATNRFRIPTGTTIPARGFLHYTATQLGFALSASGETVYLLASDGTRVVDAVRFGDQENGVAWGRFPDGAPAFHRLETVTMGRANAPRRVSEVVINEIMYAPASGDSADEFVEILNRGTTAADLGNWRLRGGINFDFPVGTVVPPGGFLVVANNRSNLLSGQLSLSPGVVLGNYGGKLDNSGDLITLDKPDQLVSTNLVGLLVTNTIHIVMDAVRYGTGGAWGRWAHGGGSSLERVDPRSDGNLAPGWADSDESGKSGWTTVEFTGRLDNGAMAAASQLQILLFGPGECLVDDVEVLLSGGANVLINGTFDTGTSGWFFQGTHEDSVWQAAGGVGDSGCLRVVASDRGDTGANRVRALLSQTVPENSVATIRAKVRWLKGHGGILLRLYGNWLEAEGRSLATRNLGSPGLANSQHETNAGPAISDVRHAPVLPAVLQPVTVTAQIADRDGVGYALLHYRVDPATNYTPTVMDYRGAGFYSGTIPGQSSGTRVAFFVEAGDGAAASVSTRFPSDAPVREGLIVFGESIPSGTLGTYRIWQTQRDVTRWTAREKQSNRALDCTFVYGNFRVCYNAGTLYSGSPFHTPGYNSPVGNLCDYEVNFASDDKLLGAEDLVLCTPGNLGSDGTLQAERSAFWISRLLGAPYLNRRYVRVYFNGQLRGSVYEDSQQPNGDLLSQYFPGDDEGSLHKIEDWFEFDNAGDAMLGNVDATLQRFTTDGGGKKTARYRWNWRPRAYGFSIPSFTNLFSLVEAMNAGPPEPYRSQVTGLVDIENFMRVLAMERIVGNADSYGFWRGKNMFAYLPKGGRWTLLPWDIDFVMSRGGTPVDQDIFGGNEPVLDMFRAFPEFQRAYWRAFDAAVKGPMTPATFAAHVDTRYAALQANGLNPDSPQELKDYVAARRANLESRLANVVAPFTLNSTVTISNGLGVITGTAPIGVSTIQVNGVGWQVTWLTLTNWTMTVPLQSGSNYFSVVGQGPDGLPVPGASNAVARIYAGATPSPVGAVVINEISYNPSIPGAEFVELFNTSYTTAFDLSGWIFNGLSYVFPGGASIAPRAHLLLVRNRAVFGAVYGPGLVIFDQFEGNLQANGETLSLLQPGPLPGQTTVVDRVRYEPGQPWPYVPRGASLQLQDSVQDNSRVANWAVATNQTIAARTIPLMNYTNAWRYMQVSNLDGVAWSAPAYNDSAWPSGPGLLAFENNASITPLIRTILKSPLLATNDVQPGHAYYFRTHVNVTNDLAGFTMNAAAYVDDGAVFYVNGFEAGRLRMDAGLVTSTTSANGQPPGGDALNADLFTLPVGRFVSGSNLIAVEVHQNQPGSSDIAFGLKLDAFHPGITNTPTPATPGAANSVVGTLTPFPALWLNEAQAENVSGPKDNAGERDPWVEIFNAGTNSIDLGGLYLSDTYTNLARWAFPPNTSLLPGQFLVVWCDGQTNQTAAGYLHTGFRLTAGSGQIALSRSIAGGIQLLDYLSYSGLAANWSYGSVPDAQPFYRKNMFYSTAVGTNNGASAPLSVLINEWMADNTRTLADPADNQFEDWFELYNAGTETADLGGYFLTDNLTNKFQFAVPNNGHYRIAPGGFLLVWADNESGQNTTNRPDLHVEFALAKSGEAIGLFAPDGTRIDAVTFGPQTSDISEGRSPDGQPSVAGMANPTPRASNYLPNTAPELDPIPPQELTLGQVLKFVAVGRDEDVPPQLLTFSLGTGAPAGAVINPVSGEFQWTPSHAPVSHSILVQVLDDGMPPLSATQWVEVNVLLPPSLEVEVNGSQLRLAWPRGTLQEAGAVEGPYYDVTSVSPITVDLSEARKFYRIRL